MKQNLSLELIIIVTNCFEDLFVHCRKVRYSYTPINDVFENEVLDLQQFTILTTFKLQFLLLIWITIGCHISDDNN